ncbi:MAG TPA: ATP-binding cassette domain-containing protein [Nitrospirae bacterium]|nr:putative HMP/thiamine import ATP-binding protein YkoD [bacterium BMS3Abin06]HDH12824.1 ATP-binding cassette domain-containing protein [Nitrospirota bacterium]HDZ01601.1 ATP-binding cassette domain-containing protein [Nitrospirota bacterium]
MNSPVSMPLPAWNGSFKVIHFQNISFKYAGRAGRSVQGVSFSVPQGQCVLVTGRTGCGKSTLLKMLGGIIPHESAGRMEGTVTVNGIDTRRSSLPVIAQYVGMVFQSPDDQLFCTTVRDELSFGPENLGIPREEIDKRVKEALSIVGLQGFEDRQIQRLSGGQKQRIAIASQLAMKPVVLALDEPVSQLDPVGTQEIVKCLHDLKQKGITIVIVEHRVDDVIGIVDRIMVMDSGRFVLDIDRKELPRHVEVFKNLGLRVPDALQIAGVISPCLSENWVRDATEEIMKRQTFLNSSNDYGHEVSRTGQQKRIVSLRDMSFSYHGAGQPALRGVSLDIYRNDIIAILGQNGSGKSTLLSILSGLNRPSTGSISMNGLSCSGGQRRNGKGSVGMVFQNPDLQLFEDSAQAEMEFGQKNLGIPADLRMEQNRRLFRLLRLEGVEDVPPHALSKGQRLRVATGAVLAMRPGLLILDEPTTGQNEENICNLIRTIRGETGIEAVVFCTHDFDTAAGFANRILLMKEGRIIADGPVTEVLGSEEILEEAGLLAPLPLILSRKAGIDPPVLTVGEFLGVVNGVL